MPVRAITRHANTTLRRSLDRHLLTFRASGAEPRAWSVPPTRLRARKQVQRAGK